MSGAFSVLAAGGIIAFLFIWVALYPEKAEKVGGWIVRLVTWTGSRARRKTVELQVQSEINAASKAASQNAPSVIEKRLKVRFHAPDEVKAVVAGGDVLVFLRRHQHHVENVAHAMMAFLPMAVLPRARRYVDAETMRAADLTLANAVLADEARPAGALECFHQHHLDPAAEESDEMRTKLAEMDEIDLHGWLTRVLLAEYKALGEQLYPGVRHDAVLRETERFQTWLYRLASLKPGDVGSLRFEGKLLRVAVIFVARPEIIEKKGPSRYWQRAKSLIYDLRFDAVYLMARDHNIPALKQVIDVLGRDARIAEATLYEYPVRGDFAIRRLSRERAALGCVRRLRSGGEAVPVAVDLTDDADLPDEVYKPGLDDDLEGEVADQRASATTEGRAHSRPVRSG